jgi:hypothetical protein
MDMLHSPEERLLEIFDLPIKLPETLLVGERGAF